MQLLNWDEIVETEEYQDDLALLAKIITQAFGNAQIILENNVFVQVMSHLLACQRYMINHIPDIKDLEESAYLELIAQEIGFNVPVLEGFPMQEFLRENKRWFGHKGTEVLYQFLGALIGSEIEVYYPQDLILKLDVLRTRLSGGASTQGKLAFKNSNLARIRDGRYYARFVYVVDVLQGQLVDNWQYLFLMLDSIHPAGLKRFIKIRNYYIAELDPEIEKDKSGYYRKRRAYFYSFRKYKGLSNGFRLSDPSCMLDQIYSFSWVGHTWIRQTAPSRSFNYSYRTIAQDSFMHVYPTGYPEECFFKWKAGLNGDYEKVYAEDDGEIMSIQTTNMSFGEIPLGDLAGRTLREIKYIAMGNRGQNPSTLWYRDIPSCTIEERTP